MTENLRITDPMEPSIHAAQEVARIVRGVQPTLTDGAARTIAGWWAGDGVYEAATLLDLSLGREVRSTDVIADLEWLMSRDTTLHPCDRDAIDALMAWAEENTDLAALPVCSPEVEVNV